mgnify:FL=1
MILLLYRPSFMPHPSVRPGSLRLCRVTLLFILCALTFGASDAALAQTNEYSTTYRPRVEYVERASGPFSVIYQRGYDLMAKQAVAELHAELGKTDSLIGASMGGRSFRLPVVLNAYNDRSNGFVSSFPFKTEIELPTLRSPALIAGFDTWTGIVGPHELVHAMHGDAQAGFGVGRVLGWMGDDLERVVNLSVPRGWTEGVAVYRESRIVEGGGRLNAPRFTMRYRAAMESDDPWSLAQMMEPPAFTQPFDRFYVGGAHAFTHVALSADLYNPGAFERTTTFFNRFPFLGFGAALWYGTGVFPNNLGASLRANAPDAVPRQSDRASPSVVSGEEGLNHYRPVWMTEDEVLTYARGYRLRPGLYAFDVQTGERRHVLTQAIADNISVNLSPDSTTLWTARYVPDAFSSRQARAEVQPVRLDRSGQNRPSWDAKRGRRTHRERVMAPAETVDGRLLAVRNDGQITDIVERKQDGSFDPITDYANVRVIQIEPSPVDARVAVLALVDGKMSVYQLQERSQETGYASIIPWLSLPGYRIYDIHWGPNGRYLAFSAAMPQPRPTASPVQPDAQGIPNVYVLDTKRRTVTRQTDAKYGALMPSISPDVSTIAYIRYRHERRDLVTTPFDSTHSPVTDVVRFGPGSESMLRRTPPEVADVEWGEPKPYRSWRHLSPRVIYPVVRSLDEESIANELPLSEGSPVGFGVGVQGVDPLQRWTYGAEAWLQDADPWGEATVAYAGYPVQPSLSAFHRPTRISGASRIQETGVGLGLTLPVTFASNVYTSSARVGLRGEWRRTQLDDRSGTPNPAVERATLSPFATVGYRLQANPRDLIPNSGIVLSSTASLDAWTATRDVNAGAERGVLGIAAAYLPWLSRWNTGIQVSAGLVSQRQGTEFGLGTFLPRGSGDAFIGSGTFVRLKGEVVQPLWYVDDGSVLFPVYMKAFYGYGFASTFSRPEALFRATPDRLSALGAGVGVRLRVFSLVDLDLRMGAAYRPGPGDVVPVYR